MKPLFFLITLLLGLAQFTPALGAQADQRCFAETGICISGPIRSYWESHGGLATFGLPLGQQRLETVEGRTLQVQWFERDRLEIQADGMVTAGRLGARYLERQGRPWQSFTGVALASPGCAFFDVTSHQLCEPFLTYWRTQGGLERFGYPITEVVDEQIEGRTRANASNSWWQSGISRLTNGKIMEVACVGPSGYAAGSNRGL
jgi:hypothetical protein